MHDPHQAGFITLDELYNIFSNALHEVDNKLWVDNGPVPRKTHVIEFIDGLKLRLIQRAKLNLNDYLKKHPVVLRKAAEYSKQVRIDQEAINAPDSRAKWMEQRSRNRFGQ